MRDKFIAIILAAGKGKRMKTDIAKQYIELNGKPLLYYSLKAFDKSSIDEIILVVEDGEEELRRSEYVDKFGFKKIKHVVAGGKERYNSVYEGLKNAFGAEYVLIHDGARPLVTNDIIENVIACVKEKKACITAVPSKDTIKIAGNNNVVDKTIDRSTAWMIQTPQAFSYKLIKGAYDKIAAGEIIDDKAITDDAMVVEIIMQQPVFILEGSYRNIKVTTQEDLIFAKALINNINTI